MDALTVGHDSTGQADAAASDGEVSTQDPSAMPDSPSWHPLGDSSDDDLNDYCDETVNGDYVGVYREHGSDDDDSSDDDYNPAPGVCQLSAHLMGSGIVIGQSWGHHLSQWSGALHQLCCMLSGNVLSL